MVFKFIPKLTIYNSYLTRNFSRDIGDTIVILPSNSAVPTALVSSCIS